MTSIQRPLANDTLYRRIDEMKMSAPDREYAKAQLRAGERMADDFCDLLAALRSCAEFIVRNARAARAASPQH
jgi:hypothetical protein